MLPAGYVISTVSVELANLTGVTLEIDGVIEASKHWEHYPLNDGGNMLDFINFNDCKHLTIKGHGMVDGLGYDWWLREWNQTNIYGRPNLLDFKRVQYAEITGVEWRNAPAWNMQLDDIDSVYIHDFEINVDILSQRGQLSENSPESFSLEEQLF